MATAEKVHRTGITRDKDLMYYIKNGDVWAVTNRGRGNSVFLFPSGVKMDRRYVYFLDEDGDISRTARDANDRPQKTRTALKNGRTRDKDAEAKGDWSDEELRGSVDAYLDIADRTQRGDRVNKAETHRALARKFGRTAKSFEFRMQNISAALEELGLPWIPGYAPARNVGDRVKERLRRFLNRPHALAAGLAPTADAEQLRSRARAAGAFERSAPPAGQASPTTRETQTTSYVRDPQVVAWVLAQADGRCELCGSDAPFLDRDGQPYLEVHHVTTLGSGGPDVTTNAVALCPNCHRRCHYSADAKIATGTLYRTVARLVRVRVP